MHLHEELTPRPSQALVWQVVDSAFPIGGFAHSLGLEAAVQAGDVPDRDALSRFVRSALLQAGYGVLPLVTAAVRQPERLAELDALADAFLTNPVVNRASRVQGRTLVATCVRVWPSHATRAVQSSMAALAGHAAPLTGVAFRAIGLPLWTIQEIVLFAVARGVLSAAVRLGVIGSYDAQRLQHESSVQQGFVLERCSDLDLDHLAQPAPILDLVHASHDRLYSRLFQS
jgi:urease accessory protein